jgi:hypothetical protein
MGRRVGFALIGGKEIEEFLQLFSRSAISELFLFSGTLTKEGSLLPASVPFLSKSAQCIPAFQSTYWQLVKVYLKIVITVPVSEKKWVRKNTMCLLLAEARRVI